MRATVGGANAGRLERSCGPRPESVRFGTGGPGLERAEIYLASTAYAPHRHDTYAIGITTAGVQTFRYRGERRICVAGQLHILHPDEPHDGAAATSTGFGYRILYLAPELIRDALGGRALPFVADPVQDLTPAGRRLAGLLADIDEPVGELAGVDIAVDIADGLTALAGGAGRRGDKIDIRSAALARDYLAAHPRAQTPASTLEQITGTDRFTLARQFRRAYGTSPDRYRTGRRLDLARAAIERGVPLAEAAADAGFADQSHLTRQFKRAYGLTPARWANAVRPTPSAGGLPPPGQATSSGAK